VAPKSDADKKAAARKAYDEGMKKLEAKDYAGALTAFQKADELMPAAAAKHKMALCHDGLGHVSEAIANFEAFVAAANPEKQKEQIDSSNKRLTALKATPAAVRVTTVPPDASIAVDGQAQMGMTPMDLKLAPGKHTVKAVAPGYESAEQQIDLKPGEKAPDLTLTLTKKAEPPPPAPVDTPPPAAPAATTTTTTSAPPPAAAEDKPRSNVPAYVTLGIAGVGAAVGTIFGIKALSDKKDFDDRPTPDKADSTERNALVSDMAFGVAITLGVTGAVLLLSNNKSEPAQQRGALDTAKKTMRFSPYVTPHGAGAGASWRF